MIDKILNKFGYYKNIDIAKAIVENDELRNKIDKLEREQILVEPGLGDPAPEDEEEYKAYVAQVASLYKDILEPKLKQMISVTYNKLGKLANDKELDLILKGAIFSYNDFIFWGEAMVNKDLAIREKEKEKDNS